MLAVQCLEYSGIIDIKSKSGLLYQILVFSGSCNYVAESGESFKIVCNSNLITLSFDILCPHSNVTVLILHLFIFSVSIDLCTCSFVKQVLPQAKLGPQCIVL